MRVGDAGAEGNRGGFRWPYWRGWRLAARWNRVPRRPGAPSAPRSVSAGKMLAGGRGVGGLACPAPCDALCTADARTRLTLLLLWLVARKRAAPEVGVAFGLCTTVETGDELPIVGDMPTWPTIDVCCIPIGCKFPESTVADGLLDREATCVPRRLWRWMW